MLASGCAPPPPRSAWQRWGRNLAALPADRGLGLPDRRPATVVDVPGHGTFLALDAADGARLAIGLLSILVAHEMGHYLAARYYRVDATLPFFIPFPVPGVSLVGTLGAFIRIRSPDPPPARALRHRRRRPARGLRRLPARALARDPRGHASSPSPRTPAGSSSASRCCSSGSRASSTGPIPDDQTLVMGPLGLAAWFGLFVTALNLMPIGQLDGGHVTYALLRDRAHRDLARRLVGVRGARLLRPELDPVGRSSCASWADATRRRSTTTRRSDAAARRGWAS